VICIFDSLRKLKLEIFISYEKRHENDEQYSDIFHPRVKCGLVHLKYIIAKHKQPERGRAYQAAPLVTDKLILWDISVTALSNYELH
jgi:hypothetical protein